MEHINKVEIRGNVGTVRMNEHNGKKVVNFSVVTDFLYKSREGIPLSETTWHNVVAWSGKDIVTWNSSPKVHKYMCAAESVQTNTLRPMVSRNFSMKSWPADSRS